MIDKKHIIEELCRQFFGIDTYLSIMEKFNTVDVSLDTDFQKSYNGFYGVRRNKEWRKHYYELFQGSKLQPQEISFEYIIQQIYERTGQVEASFSSKMLATINPKMPLWDRRVLICLALEHKGITPREKIINAIDIYGVIEAKYKEKEFQAYIKIFDEYLPQYKQTNISDTKKIDCFIWLLGK